MAQPRYSRPIEYTSTSDGSGSRIGKRIVIGLLVLIVLGLGGAWAMSWFSGGSLALAEVQQLQAKLADPVVKDEDRRALWRDLREKMDALSPQEQEAAWESGRERFEQRMNDRIKEVLAMSKADQTKALDADIDRMRRFQSQRDADRSATAGQGNNPQGNAQQGNNRANRQRGGYRPDSDRVAQLKNRLDRSTPQVRAMRLQYRQLMDQRIQQRGLPPNTRRWG